MCIRDRKVYGPFGNANGHEGDCVPFKFADVVVGFYGRSGTYLDAIGFDIDVADFMYPSIGRLLSLEGMEAMLSMTQHFSHIFPSESKL